MSQCDYSLERLEGFITEKDFETIASWGADHVRLPVDYDVFDAGEQESGFFENREYQERFFRLWERLAEEFGADHENVAFDLLNEITDASYLPEWKKISAECIRRIRSHAPETAIVIGSYDYNDVRAVKDLDAPQDRLVAYSFHCYEPHEFTHQGAYWDPRLDKEKRVAFSDSGTTGEMFEGLFESALVKAAEHGADLYCGLFHLKKLLSGTR